MIPARGPGPRRPRVQGRPGWAAVLLLALVLPVSGVFPHPAVAQWVEAVELGMLGRWGVYDGALGLDAAMGWGPRVGIHLGERWVVEGDWSFQNPRAQGTITFESDESERPRTSHDLFGGRLLFQHPLGDRFGLLAGAGVQYDRYKGSPPVATSGTGVGVLLGLRVGLTRVLSLRLEGTVYQVGRDSDRTVPRPTTRNGGLQAGLAYTFRGRGRIVELPPPPPDTVIVEPRPPGVEGAVRFRDPGSPGTGFDPPSAILQPCTWNPIPGDEPCPWLRRRNP